MSDKYLALAEKAGMKLDFDPTALLEKYRHERDKRVRDDGSSQYREITGLTANIPVFRRKISQNYPKGGDDGGSA
jgi:hypothetical protein